MLGAEGALVALWTVQCAYAVAACVLGVREVAAQARRGAAGFCAPAVTVLIPAFNEAETIAACLASVRASSLRPAAVIVVDDGSSDATADLAARALSGDPTGRVIRLPQNSGKARALGAGLAVIATELVLTFDADSQLDPEALRLACGALVGQRLDAVACHVAIAQPVRGLSAFQRAEYVSSLQLARLMQARLGAVTTVPGAGGLYRTTALRLAGGFRARTRAEDTDLTLALQRIGGRIGCCAEALVWTEPPRRLAPLLRQRRRWIWGNLAAAVLHMIDRRPKPKRFRLLILPWVVISNGLSPITFCMALVLTPAVMLVDASPAVGVGAATATALALVRCMIGYRIAGFAAPRAGEMLGCVLILPIINAVAAVSGLVGIVGRRALPW